MLIAYNSPFLQTVQLSDEKNTVIISTPPQQQYTKVKKIKNENGSLEKSFNKVV